MRIASDSVAVLSRCYSSIAANIGVWANFIYWAKSFLAGRTRDTVGVIKGVTDLIVDGKAVTAGRGADAV